MFGVLPKTGPLGYLVRTGSFPTRETTGPWVVHVLGVEPDLYNGTVTPELATEVVPGRETLTSISNRTDSLAAMNGGYFVIGENDGTPGDLAGISVIDGAFVSEAVDVRACYFLQDRARERTSRPSRTP
jgi:hypothetical protein